MSKLIEDTKIQLEQAEQAKLTAFVQQPLQREAVNGLYNFTRLHNGVRQSNIYRNAHIMMPVAESTIFHPYHPTDVSAKEYGGLAASIITMRCPADMMETMFKCLPLSIQQLYGPAKLDIKKASIYFGTQNIPWGTKDTTPLLIRPHYWLFGSPDNDKAMGSFVFNQSLQCRVGIFEPSDNKITCSGVQNKLLSYPIKLTAHPDRPAKPTMIICSPDDKKGKGGVLTNVDYEKTICFYSVVIDPKSRSEIKFHIFLNSEDQKRLAALSQSSDKAKSLQDIVNSISEWKESQLNAKGGPIEQLCKLFNMKVEPKAKVADKKQMSHEDELAQALAASLALAQASNKQPEEDKHEDEKLKQALLASEAFALKQQTLQTQEDKDLEEALKASQAQAPVAPGFGAHKQMSKEQELKILKDNYEVEKKKLADQAEILRRLITQCNQALHTKYSVEMAQAVKSLPGILQDCRNLYEKIEENTQDAVLISTAIESYALNSLDFIRKKVPLWDQKIGECQALLKKPGNNISPSTK